MSSEAIDEQDCDKKVGQSTFYGTPLTLGEDPLSQELSPTEKQDSMKSSDDEDNVNS